MSTTIKPPLSGHDGDNRYPVSALEPPMSECLTAILQSLKTMKEGDFSVRLPVSWTGLPGKIADNFNEIVIANEQMAFELKRVGQAVGKEGKTRERIRVEHRRGAWDDMEVSVNTLVEDLAAANDRSHPRHRRRGPGKSHPDRSARRRRPSA